MTYPLLRVLGAAPRDPTIERWFSGKPVELVPLARTWFSALRGCGEDVLEVLHDGFPTVCVEDAPFGYVNIAKAHITIAFFHGASLPDPRGRLEGAGKYLRHVKLRPGQVGEDAALQGLIDAAYADIRARLRAERREGRRRSGNGV